MQASDFSPLIRVCFAEVLDTMYFTSVLGTVHHFDRQAIQADNNLTYTLRFEGDICGSFGLTVPIPMGRILASNFLGEDEETMSRPEVSEVIAELANMLCGSMVSRIDSSHKFVLLHPEPLVTPLTPGNPGEDILVSILTTDSGELHTWIIVEESDPSDLRSVEEAPMNSQPHS